MPRRDRDEINDFIDEVYQNTSDDRSAKDAYDQTERSRPSKMFSSFKSFQESRRRMINNGGRSDKSKR